MAFNVGLLQTILKDIETVDNLLQTVFQAIGGRGGTVLNPNTQRTVSQLVDHSSNLVAKAKTVDIASLTAVVDPVYIWPPVGTRLSPAVNTLAYPTDANNQNYVNRYKQAAAQQTALNMTAEVKEGYLITTFPNWLISYEAGRDKKGAIPPEPPKGFMAVVILAEGGDLEWDIQQVDHWVCAIPSYLKVPTK